MIFVREIERQPSWWILSYSNEKPEFHSNGKDRNPLPLEENGGKIVLEMEIDWSGQARLERGWDQCQMQEETSCEIFWTA